MELCKYCITCLPSYSLAGTHKSGRPTWGYVTNSIGFFRSNVSLHAQVLKSCKLNLRVRYTSVHTQHWMLYIAFTASVHRSSLYSMSCVITCRLCNGVFILFLICHLALAVSVSSSSSCLSSVCCKLSPQCCSKVSFHSEFLEAAK